MTRPGTREGFALPAALLALIIVGGLVTGGVYAAMVEDRSSGNAEFGELAFMAADRGLQELLGTKTRPYFENEVGPVGAADTIGPVAITIGDVDAQYTLYVQRLATRMFMVTSDGEVLSGGRYAGSKRRIAEVMRINHTNVPKDRAYTTHTELRIRGKSAVHGQDTIQPGWSDCTNEGNKTAVVTTDTLSIDVPPGGGNPALVGNPRMEQDAAMDSLDFVQYGDLHVDDLKRYANVAIPPGTYTGIGPVSSGGVCDRSAMLNWGDPNDAAGPCHTYWPIIYSAGDLHLSTGVGQGILIVEGTLQVSGNFQFNGIVFVYGNVKATGSGNKFLGSVNILGSSGYSELGISGAGDTRIQLSSCAIDRAHEYNDRFARPILLSERSFVDLSGIGSF